MPINIGILGKGIESVSKSSGGSREIIGIKLGKNFTGGPSSAGDKNTMLNCFRSKSGPVIQFWLEKEG